MYSRDRCSTDCSFSLSLSLALSPSASRYLPKQALCFTAGAGWGPFVAPVRRSQS